MPMYVSKERAVNAKFTIPYASASKAIFYVRRGNPTNFDPMGGNFTVGEQNCIKAGLALMIAYHPI